MNTRRSRTTAPRLGQSARAPVALLVPDLPSADEVAPYLRRIDASAWYTNHGPLVRELEVRCADLLDPGAGTRCVAVASGTAAIELALRAVALPPGSRVMLPAFTFPATLIAVARAGHQPVLADVDAARWTLSPATAPALARRYRCAAIMPVAAFGVPLELDRWDAVAEEGGFAVVIDGAGALGAMPAARRVTVAFSLHATKPLGIGEGGVIATPDDAVAERARRLANYGFVSHRIDEAGTNAKLSEYAAAVGLAQLDRAGDLLARRRGLWQPMREAIAAVPMLEMQQGLCAEAPANVVVRVPGDATRWQARLARDGIETRRWYCPPLHLHPAFAAVPHAGALTQAERLGQEALGLPFHTRMTVDDVRRIATALEDAAG